MEQWDMHAHACMDMEASIERSQVPRTDLINWIEDRMKHGLTQCAPAQGLCAAAQMVQPRYFVVFHHCFVPIL